MPEETKKNGGGKVVKFDLARGLVEIDGRVYPTKPLNQDTLPRLMQREHGGQPVSIEDLLEPFAGSDDEQSEVWTRAKVMAIRNKMIGEDPALVPVRIYGPSGGGRMVGIRLAPASDQECLDQLVDAALRAQRRQDKAGERYRRFQETAKKYGIDLA